MADAWFVSDIHIESMEDEKARVFLAFLNTLGNLRPASHLFLVGDIFDLWVGPHHYFQQRFEPIIRRIKEIVDNGVEVHYFEGNHDLHLKKFWEESVGVKVHPGPEYFKVHGKTLRVEHGDQSDPEDKGYRFLRWFLRTPALTFLAHHLPEALVAWIGNRASHASRDYTSQTKTIDADTARVKLHLHANRVFQQRPFDLLVNGHVHIVDEYDTKNFSAINLGTWLEKPRALRLGELGPEFIQLK